MSKVSGTRNINLTCKRCEMKLQLIKKFGFLSVYGLTASLQAATLGSTPNSNACDVAIIGGGPGGTHTAYKLITQKLTNGNVCLFEKKAIWVAVLEIISKLAYLRELQLLQLSLPTDKVNRLRLQ